jgi:hypothetical protein
MPKRNSKAEKWLHWAEELDAKSELGPVFSERIAKLKARI